MPREHSTGCKPVLGHMSTRGSNDLRTLAIQSAPILLMRPQIWHKVSFGLWLKQASKRLGKNKLAGAHANKLARIAWRVFRSGKPFDQHRDMAKAV